MNVEMDISKNQWRSTWGKSVHFKKTVAQSSFLSKVFVMFAEIKTKSGKLTTLLKEMRIAQLSS